MGANCDWTLHPFSQIILWGGSFTKWFNNRKPLTMMVVFLCSKEFLAISFFPKKTGAFYWFFVCWPVQHITTMATTTTTTTMATTTHDSNVQVILWTQKVKKNFLKIHSCWYIYFHVLFLFSCVLFCLT